MAVFKNLGKYKNLGLLIIAALTQFSKGGGVEGAAHAIEDAIMFLGLFFIGPGIYSIDKK